MNKWIGQIKYNYNTCHRKVPKIKYKNRCILDNEKHNNLLGRNLVKLFQNTQIVTEIFYIVKSFCVFVFLKGSHSQFVISISLLFERFFCIDINYSRHSHIL